MFRHPVKLHQAMLGVAPKRFNTVNMPRTANKLIVTMMYPEMFGKTHVNQSLITAPTVSIDDTPDTDTTSNDLLQRCFGSIGNNLGINLVPRFKMPKTMVSPPAPRPRLPLKCRIKVSASLIRQPNAGAISGTGC